MFWIDDYSLPRDAVYAKYLLRIGNAIVLKNMDAAAALYRKSLALKNSMITRLFYTLAELKQEKPIEDLLAKISKHKKEE